jgi:hypothetical protein
MAGSILAFTVTSDFSETGTEFNNIWFGSFTRRSISTPLSMETLA